MKLGLDLDLALRLLRLLNLKSILARPGLGLYNGGRDYIEKKERIELTSVQSISFTCIN